MVDKYQQNHLAQMMLEIYSWFLVKKNLTQSKDFKFHNANSAIDKKYYLKNPFDKNLSNIEDWDWKKK